MGISAQPLPWRPPSTRHPSGAGAQPVYRPRQPAASALYAVGQHHIETFLAHAAEVDPVGYGVPTWVEKDLRAYRRCGILAYGPQAPAPLSPPQSRDCRRAVLGIFLRAIRTTLRRTSLGASPGAQLGAVSFLHRFGSSLKPHVRFHLVVLDGGFEQAPDGTVRFHDATWLTPDHWLALQRLVQRRVLRHFRTQGLLEERDAVGMKFPGFSGERRS